MLIFVLDKIASVSSFFGELKRHAASNPFGISAEQWQVQMKMIQCLGAMQPAWWFFGIRFTRAVFISILRSLAWAGLSVVAFKSLTDSVIPSTGN
jgi:hypothetical protein